MCQPGNVAAGTVTLISGKSWTETTDGRKWIAMILPRFVVVGVVAGISMFVARNRAGAASLPLAEVPIQAVTIDDPFWSPKLSVWRTVTMGDCLDKFDREGAILNFDHVARGELTADHRGQPWYDGLIYEMIRAAGDFQAEKPDPELEARIDAYIGRICAAATRDPDGYINTYTQMREPQHRWGQNGGND